MEPTVVGDAATAQRSFYGEPNGHTTRETHVPKGANRVRAPSAAHEDFGAGLTPITPGLVRRERARRRVVVHGDEGRGVQLRERVRRTSGEFAQFGINVTVLEPGQSGLYHSEATQEAFLVLSGVCTLLVEGRSGALGRWDSSTLPRGPTPFVGAGDGPCVILMVGSRSEAGEVRYPVSELAARSARAWRRRPPTGAGLHEAEWFRRERPPNWALAALGASSLATFPHAGARDPPLFGSRRRSCRGAFPKHWPTLCLPPSASGNGAHQCRDLGRHGRPSPAAPLS